MAKPKLKLVRAKCGCDGCFFENETECPGFETDDFEACHKAGEHLIFVPDEEGDDNGTRV